MCLAIYKPAGLTVSRDHLENGFKSNPHGAGFAVTRPDRSVLICKGFFDFNSFHDAYVKVSENQALQAIIHFRFATHGKKNDFNCHPWPLGPHETVDIPGVPLAYVAGAAMIHNGVLNHRSDDERSDTGYYVTDVLDKVYAQAPGFIGEMVFVNLIEDHIGTFNKFCLIDGTGAFSIMNAQQGEVHEGVWFSNADFRRAYGRWASTWPDDDDMYGGDWRRGVSAGSAALPYKSTAAEAAKEEALGDQDLEVILPGTMTQAEIEEVRRLVDLFPDIVRDYEHADDLLQFFRAARIAYRKHNPEAAKEPNHVVDQMMFDDGFADSLAAAPLD